MANTSLASLIAEPGTSKATQYGVGQSPSDEMKLEAILSLAELMQKGTRSTGAIMAWLSEQGLPDSHVTAIKYRNLAMTLLARENKPMNRDNMRALEVGRLTYWIERLTEKIKAYEGDEPNGDTDYKYWDTYAKLVSKLNDFGARLHAITGLNEITVNNTDDRKRIIFLRPGEQPKQPMSHNASVSVEVQDVTEGDVITPTT